MNEKEAIIDYLNGLEHKGYQCDPFGGRTKQRNEMIADILRERLDEEYEHTAERCRFCKEVERAYERICGE